MKKILCLIFALLLCSCGNSKPVEKRISHYESCVVTDYTMNLSLDTNMHVLSGIVKMDIVNNTEDVIDNLCIRNFANAYLKECSEVNQTDYVPMKVNSIKRDDTQQSLSFTYHDNKTTFIVDLEDNALQPNDKMILVLEYQTDIPNYSSRFSYIKNENGTLYSLTNCFPMLANYQNGLWDQSPAVTVNGESNFNKMTNYHVTLNIPENFVVVASGDETVIDHGIIIEANNVREMAIVACDYMEVETKTTKQGINVNFYHINNVKNEDYKYFSLYSGVESMELFSELIGKYPYEELDIVQSNFLGMEFPGLIMNGYYNTEQVNYSQLCRVTCHEIGHQWFYNAVGSHPYKEPWLDEGLTSYLEEIYLRSKLPIITQATNLDIKLGQRTTTNGLTDEEYEETRNMDLNTIKTEGLFIDNPFDGFETQYGNLYGTGVYNGGAYFLIELRESMGEEIFDEMLRDYYSSYYFKEATTDDFFNVVKSYDNSKEVNQLIRTYFRYGYFN